MLFKDVWVKCSACICKLLQSQKNTNMQNLEPSMQSNLYSCNVWLVCDVLKTEHS